MTRQEKSRLRKIKSKRRCRLVSILILVIIIAIIIIKSKFYNTKQNVSENNVKNTKKVELTENQKLNNKYSLQDTTYSDEDGKLIVKNVDDIYVLVNRDRNLPSNYVPEDLVTPDIKFSYTLDSNKKEMRKEAAESLENLCSDAENEGIEFYGISGYRSYDIQNQVFEDRIKKVGKEKAEEFVAYPGQSEHQTGLAIDITGKSVLAGNSKNFEVSEEKKWLEKNCYKYGFIIRFPKGKEDITGYSYEPWHIRYVGKAISEYIYSKNITLEEFFEDIKE